MAEDFGLKVSKTGFDVFTADNGDLIFSSGLATHPIESITSVTVNADPYTISHGLSFIPKVWVYEHTGSILRRIPNENANGSIDYYIDSSNIVIESESTRRDFNAIVIVFARSIV